MAHSAPEVGAVRPTQMNRGQKLCVQAASTAPIAVERAACSAKKRRRPFRCCCQPILMAMATAALVRCASTCPYAPADNPRAARTFGPRAVKVKVRSWSAATNKPSAITSDQPPWEDLNACAIPTASSSGGVTAAWAATSAASITTNGPRRACGAQQSRLPDGRVRPAG